ncbi:hypothetical protein CHUAL_008433 [Chamberlinius hualienensis]
MDNNSSDSIDSKHLSSQPGDSFAVGLSSATISRSAEYYSMNKNRGLALIFNHKYYKQSLGMPTRSGTEVDSANLQKLFKQIGFTVKAYDDLTYNKIKEKLAKASADVHQNNDCFVCIVLSHGDEGFLYSSDTKYQPSDLWTPFLAHKCPSLAGKPKLFFIQACRGEQLDVGVSVIMTDSISQVRLPSHADFLIAYSTVPGYYSWRNTTNGSWFIQALCNIFMSNYETSDLLSMMLLVNRKVALDFESSTVDIKMHQKKQIPYIAFTLTRKVFFGKQ